MKDGAYGEAVDERRALVTAKKMEVEEREWGWVNTEAGSDTGWGVKMKKGSILLKRVWGGVWDVSKGRLEGLGGYSEMHRSSVSHGEGM